MAALRQLLISHMDGQEDVDRDRERGEARLRELRAGPLQGSEENTAPRGSVENGAERTDPAHARTENRHELPSGDTGFFETSEDFGEEISQWDLYFFIYFANNGDVLDLFIVLYLHATLYFPYDCYI